MQEYASESLYLFHVSNFLQEDVSTIFNEVQEMIVKDPNRVCVQDDRISSTSTKDEIEGIIEG